MQSNQQISLAKQLPTAVAEYALVSNTVYDIFHLQRTNLFWNSTDNLIFWKSYLRKHFDCCDSFLHKFDLKQLKTLAIRLSHIKQNDAPHYYWLSENVLKTDSVDYLPLYAERLPENLDSQLKSQFIIQAARCGNSKLISEVSSNDSYNPAKNMIVRTGHLPFIIKHIERSSLYVLCAIYTREVNTFKYFNRRFLFERAQDDFLCMFGGRNIINYVHEYMTEGYHERNSFLFTSSNMNAAAKYGDLEAVRYIYNTRDIYEERQPASNLIPAINIDYNQFYKTVVESGNMELMKYTEEVILKDFPLMFANVEIKELVLGAASSGSLPMYLKFLQPYLRSYRRCDIATDSLSLDDEEEQKSSEPKIAKTSELENLFITSLNLAAKAGGLVLVKYLTEEKSIVPNHKTLMEAIYCGNFKLTEYILEKGSLIPTIDHIKRSMVNHRFDSSPANFAILNKLFNLCVEHGVITHLHKQELMEYRSFAPIVLTKYHMQQILFKHPKLNNNPERIPKIDSTLKSSF